MKSRPIESKYPPDRYEYVENVPVFKTHVRKKNGVVVKVTRDDLEETARVHNWLWDALERASPFAEGHTLDNGPDGADVPESEQPDGCGVGIKFHVGKWPLDPEPDYLFCTGVFPKDDIERIKKTFYSLSPEYYPKRHWLYPISMLKTSAPELEMPPIPFRYGVEEESYRFTLPTTFHYSQENETMPFDDKKDEKDTKPEKPADKPEDKAMVDAEKKETKGSKQDGADLNDLKQMLTQVMSQMERLAPLAENADKLMQVVQLLDEEGDGEDDLMKPDDGPKPTPEVEKGAPKPDEKDAAKEFNSPVKFETGMPSATNGSIPSFDKKESYKVTSEEAVKYKKELDATRSELSKLKTDLEATRKVSADLYKKNRKAEAEKVVYSLENEHNIAFQSPDARQEEIDLIAQLDENAVGKWVERCKVRYQKRLPNSDAVKEVAKYAVESEPDLGAKTPEEAFDRAMKEIKRRAEADNKKAVK